MLIEQLKVNERNNLMKNKHCKLLFGIGVLLVASMTALAEESAPESVDEEIAPESVDREALTEEPTMEELPVVDDRPFGRGAMEISASLGGAGWGGDFTLSIGASFAYYVINGLAPGLDVQYETTFSDLEYPQSFTLLPFIKYVFYRSIRFSPYVVVAGGREFQWAGTDNPAKGYSAIDSWIVGGGPGVNIGLNRRFGLSIEVLFLYYFFDESAYVVDLSGESKKRDGMLTIPITIGFAIRF